MKTLLLVAICLPLISNSQRYFTSTVLVISECSSTHRSNRMDSKHGIETDSIWVNYCGKTPSINDTIVKYVGADSLNVETMLIANPSNVLADIYFGRFPNLQRLILAGNDADYIDSMNYGFFSNKKLKTIVFSSVYLKTLEGHDPEWHFKKRMTQFIHVQRRDVKLRFFPMGRYNDIGWH